MSIFDKVKGWLSPKPPKDAEEEAALLAAENERMEEKLDARMPANERDFRV